MPRQVLLALTDVKAYLDALIVAAFGLGVAAFGLFMPTFINEFGFSPREFFCRMPLSQVQTC